MKTLINKVFVNHPASVDEDYFEHMAFASVFALKLFAAAGAAIVHAVIPCLFEKTAGNIIKELYGRINNR